MSGVTVITIDNPPVNATSHAVRVSLMRAIESVNADDSVSAAVIIGAGKTFVAGADIREFGAPLADPQMPTVIAAIIESRKPFVAALHGHALGGGFELALACDARIAAPGTRVGLPEVTLGMIPGAGGTQHLPRLVGIARAVDLVCTGRRIDTEEALRLGLIDAIAEGDLREAAIAHAASLTRKRRLRDLAVPSENEAAIEATCRQVLESQGDSVQVREGIAAVRAAATLPYFEALAREREVFQRLRASDEAAALRAKFFAKKA
jgi:3-hydroxyacyl-CoA dehydrogenase